MNCTLYHAKSQRVEEWSDELLESWKSDVDSVLWLHISGEMSDEIAAQLADTFELHSLALQDAQRERHPPKYELFKEHSFFIFKVIASSTTESIDIKSAQLAVFVGERFMITRESAKTGCIEQFRSEVSKDPSMMSEQFPDTVCRLFRILIDEYLDILLTLEPKLDSLEEGLLNPDTGDEVLAELTGYKTSLKRLRRIFLYQEGILNHLRQQPPPEFSTSVRHLLTDVFEQQERASSLALLYYEMASDLIDGYLSMASHRLNGIMKILTIVTSVFIPLGFLAGIYGMNFEYMPELKAHGGYFMLLSVMAAVVIFLMLIFRKKKWI